MKAELNISDTAKDELAKMSEIELEDYCRSVANSSTEAILALADEARKALPAKPSKPKFRSYWHCVVAVDIPEGEMPSGADSPLREAVQHAAERLHPQAHIVDCSSGWGLNARGADVINCVSSMDANCISREEVLKRDGDKKGGNIKESFKHIADEYDTYL